MSPFNMQWSLRGPASSYLVVWWYDEAAKDKSRHVSPLMVSSLLDQWLGSRKRVLQEIHDALEGVSTGTVLRTGREENEVRLKNRLNEAFQMGRLVVLEANPTQQTGKEKAAQASNPAGLLAKGKGTGALPGFIPSNLAQQGAQQKKTPDKAGTPGQSPAQELENLKTRLYGLEKLYLQVKEYRSLAKTASRLPRRDEFGVYDPTGGYLENRATQRAKELTTELQRHGFKSIEEFEQTVLAYRTAFHKATMSIAQDMLTQYEKILKQEEKKFQAAANAVALYRALGQTQARKYYKEAADQQRTADNIRPEPEIHRYLPGEWELKHKATKQAQAALAKAEAEVLKLAKAYPLLKNGNFDRKRLANAAEGEVQKLMQDYIRARQQDIAESRKNLSEKPELVYKLDALLKVSYSLQGIQPDSIHYRIIQDHVDTINASEFAIKFVLGVLALAAGLLSMGTGTVAVVAAGAGLGIGVYGAVSEFREYEIASAAHGAQLLSDEPSLVWVIVEVLAAGLDLSSAAAAVRAMKPAVTAFNATSDVTLFQKQLESLADINKTLRTRVLQAAQAEVAYRKAVTKIFSADGSLKMVLVPGAQELGKLVFVAYHLSRRGLIAFDKFILELRAQKLIGEIQKLSPEELTLLKKAFQDSQATAAEIASHGKSLGMSDEQVATFIKAWSEESGGGKLTLKQLKERMSTQAGKGAGKGTKAAASGQAVKWRDVLGADAEAVLKSVTARSRYMAEALGEMGLEVAMKRLGIKAEPRFIKRYHGADMLGTDAKRGMVGLEAKGGKDSSVALAVHVGGEKQLSWVANLKLSKKMRRKRAKIDKPSQRQGGPYTVAELALYAVLGRLKGRKRLLSSHTHTETGVVRVFERNGFGLIDASKGGPLDTFTLEDIQELRALFIKRYGK